MEKEGEKDRASYYYGTLSTIYLWSAKTIIFYGAQVFLVKTEVTGHGSQKSLYIHEYVYSKNVSNS